MIRTQDLLIKRSLTCPFTKRHTHPELRAKGPLQSHTLSIFVKIGVAVHCKWPKNFISRVVDGSFFCSASHNLRYSSYLPTLARSEFEMRISEGLNCAYVFSNSFNPTKITPINIQQSFPAKRM